MLSLLFLTHWNFIVSDQRNGPKVAVLHLAVAWQARVDFSFAWFDFVCDVGRYSDAWKLSSGSKRRE